MEFARLDDNYVVSGQIAPDDVAAIATAGFRVVVCTRPDHEQPGQATAAEIAAACEALDVVFHHIPMHGPQIPAGGVETIRALLDGAEGPVFAYCASGQRAAYLWQQANG